MTVFLFMTGLLPQFRFCFSKPVNEASPFTSLPVLLLSNVFLLLSNLVLLSNGFCQYHVYKIFLHPMAAGLFSHIFFLHYLKEGKY